MKPSSTQYISNPVSQNIKLYRLLVIVIVLLIVTIMSLLSLIIFVVSGKNEVKTVYITPTPTNISTVKPTSTPTPDPTLGWKTFISTKYNFSFKHPIDWGVADKGQGASSENMYVGLQKDVDLVISNQVSTDFIGTARFSIGTTSQIPTKNDAIDVKQEQIIVAGKQSTSYTQTTLIDIPGFGQKGKVTKRIIMQHNNLFYTFDFYDQSKFETLDLVLKNFQF